MPHVDLSADSGPGPRAELLTQRDATTLGDTHGGWSPHEATTPSGPRSEPPLRSRARQAKPRRRVPDRDLFCERAVNPPLEPDAGGRDEVQPGRLPGPIHLIEDGEGLTPNGSPGLVGPAAKFGLEPTHGTLGGQIEVISLELHPGTAFDPHLHMPAPERGGIAAQLDGHLAGVFELVVITERIVPARGREEHEVPTITEVLHVGQATCLTTSPLEFGDRQAVTGNKLRINGPRVFVFRDEPLEIEAISAAEIAHGELLDEPFE